MVIVKNRINGEKPEFGNLEHIAYCRKVERIFSGEESFHEIDWQYCHYWGASTDTNKPKFRYTDFENADAVVDYIPCPKCGRLHCLLVAFDPQGNWYDELIAIDESVKEFKCWNCGLWFETDDYRNVFVRVRGEKI